MITKKALLVWGLMFDRGIGNVSKKGGGGRSSQEFDQKSDQ